MAKKKTTRKKAQAKGDTDKARKDAIKDIDARLNGDATPSEKGGKGKGGKATKTEIVPNEKKVRKLSGLDHAAQVLAASKDPLNAKTMAEQAIAAGWKTNGKTPHATIYAAIIREIQNKGNASRFEKVDRGRFQIRKRA